MCSTSHHVLYKVYYTWLSKNCCCCHLLITSSLERNALSHRCAQQSYRATQLGAGMSEKSSFFSSVNDVSLLTGKTTLDAMREQLLLVIARYNIPTIQPFKDSSKLQLSRNSDFGITFKCFQILPHRCTNLGLVRYGSPYLNQKRFGPGFMPNRWQS